MPAPISIVNGEYSINGGPWTNAPGTVNNNDSVRVRHTSAPTGEQNQDTILDVGGVQDTFTSTTYDTTPDQFTFVDQTDVPVSTQITSDPVTPGGYYASEISVVGGLYSINGGAYTDQPGQVSAGDIIRARHTSAPTQGTPTDTVVTIGTTSDTFTSTTAVTPPPSDTDPNPFSFATRSDALEQDVAEAASPVTISGINTTAPISIASTGPGAPGEYQINGGAWTAAAGTIENGDVLRVRLPASTASSGSRTATITIGTIQGTYTVVTRDYLVDPVDFTDQTSVPVNSVVTSNSITPTGYTNSSNPVRGITASVANGEMSINAGPFSTEDAEISPLDSIRVRHTSSPINNGVVVTTLSLGSYHFNDVQQGSDPDVQITFQSTAETAVVPDTTPDPFMFIDQVDVPVNDERTSNSITITGIT